MDMLVLIEERKKPAHPALTQPQSDALAAAITKNTTLVNYIRTNKAVADAGGPAADPIKAEILNQLNQIKADLIAGDALNVTDAALPVTPVPTYSGASPFGMHMNVKPLTKLGTTGSSVSAGNPIYTDLLYRKRVAGGSNTYYVAGHLLNNNVHGDGSTWNNLTPIANTTNQEHEDKVESKVKQAAENNQILDYTVDVIYGMSLKQNLLDIIDAMPNATTDATLVKKRKIIVAEASLPKKLQCTVKQVKADGTDLASSDAGYDARYNISGGAGEIDNESHVAQDNIGVYNLSEVSGTVYKLFPELQGAANSGLQANPALEWDTFYNNPNNKQSIDNLSLTPVPDGKAQLRAMFTRKELFRAEKARIANLPETGNQIQTWLAFKAGRAAYVTGAIDPADMTTLQTDFAAKMLKVKQALFNEAQTALATVVALTHTWGAFKSANNLYAREGVLPDDDIQKFKTDHFDKRIDDLRRAGSSAPGGPPGPPAPSGPPSR